MDCRNGGMFPTASAFLPNFIACGQASMQRECCKLLNISLLLGWCCSMQYDTFIFWCSKELPYQRQKISNPQTAASIILATDLLVQLGEVYSQNLVEGRVIWFWSSVFECERDCKVCDSSNRGTFKLFPLIICEYVISCESEVKTASLAIVFIEWTHILCFLEDVLERSLVELPTSLNYLLILSYHDRNTRCIKI